MSVELAPAGEAGWEFRFLASVSAQEVGQALDGLAEDSPIGDVARMLDPEEWCDEAVDVQVARSLTLDDCAIVVNHRFPEAAAMMAGIVVQRLLQAGYRVQRAEAWPSKPAAEAESDLRARLAQAASTAPEK